MHPFHSAILGVALLAADAGVGIPVGGSPTNKPGDAGIDEQLVRLADRGQQNADRYDSVINTLREWLASQNQGDIEAYRLFYGKEIEGFETTRRGTRVLRRRAWLKEATAKLEMTKKVWISDVLIVRPEVEANSALMQVDFRQHRILKDATVETSSRRLSYYSCRSQARPTCISIVREDTLSVWPRSYSDQPTTNHTAKPVYAIVAGIHAKPAAAEQAQAGYLKANLPTHEGFPKLVPTAELGLPPTWGTALVAALPHDQRVAAILADFITRSGTAAFIHITRDVRGQDLHLAIIDPHRVTIGDLPRVTDDIGTKLPKLIWEAHQSCNGCGHAAVRGTSMASRSNGTVLCYTILHDGVHYREMIVEPKLPSPLAEKASEWGYYGLGFESRPYRSDPWSSAIHYIKDIEAAVVRISPGTVRLTDQPSEGD